MGRVIFATRDTGEFSQQSRDMRGTSDFMAEAICRNMVGEFDDEFWAPVLGCQPNEVRWKAQYQWSGVLDGKVSLPDGRKLSAWSVAMNTLKAVASEPIKLLIHIHAQCEIHAWVDEPNREWFADSIETLMEEGVLSESYWRPLITWLRETAKGPIVLSYSVCDEFPTPSMIPEFREAECAYEACEKAGWSAERLWDECFARLKAEKTLELNPDRVANTTFDANLTPYDVRRFWREHHERSTPASQEEDAL